jgi:hypothetical protein
MEEATGIRLNRRRLSLLGMAALSTGFLAACGEDEEDGEEGVVEDGEEEEGEGGVIDGGEAEDGEEGLVDSGDEGGEGEEEESGG